MFFVSMKLIFRSGGAFSSLEQVGIRQELSIISLLPNYQTITRILEDEKSCQVPCFFMRLGMGSLVQLIDTLPFSQKPSCQLVQILPQEWNPWRFAIKYLLAESSGLKRLFPDKFVKLYNLSGNKGVFMDDITSLNKRSQKQTNS